MSSSMNTAVLADSHETPVLVEYATPDALSVPEPALTRRSLDKVVARGRGGPWIPREEAFPPAWLEPSEAVDDVRAMAALAERRRIAREMHDGVAQDVASLSYLVDDLSRRDCNEQHQPDLVHVREELTRIVTELRNCIFDLRTGVSADDGLGAVLARSVKATGTTSSAAVHITLNESSERLPQYVETELLRIAQEAVANALAHACASNIWVSCTVQPPFADLRVDDDGIGSASVRDHHFGLEIMQERAERINAALTVAERPGGGTRVSAVLCPSEPPRVHPLPGGGHALQRATRR